MRVCAIALTADRQDYTDRAVQCFMNQTYPEAELLIYDTGKVAYEPPNEYWKRIRACYLFTDPGNPATIGALRNQAIELASGADIIVHWDVDDWSAPSRIEEQVRVLMDHPNIEATGYNTMLFWDTVAKQAWSFRCLPQDQSVGTALCYRRSAWERACFPDTSRGEDTLWLRENKIKTAAYSNHGMMIADLHPGNTCSRIEPSSSQWKRVPDLDGYCQRHSLATFLEGRK